MYEQEKAGEAEEQVVEVQEFGNLQMEERHFLNYRQQQGFIILMILSYFIEGHTISNIRSDYNTIDALGMANVDYYSDATKKGILQHIGDDIAPHTSIAIFNTKTNAMIFVVGDDANKLLMNADYIQARVLEKDGQEEYIQQLASGKNIKMIIMKIFMQHI